MKLQLIYPPLPNFPQEEKSKAVNAMEPVVLMEKLTTDKLLSLYIRAQRSLISSSSIYTHVWARKQMAKDVLNSRIEHMKSMVPIWHWSLISILKPWGQGSSLGWGVWIDTSKDLTIAKEKLERVMLEDVNRRGDQIVIWTPSCRGSCNIATRWELQGELGWKTC